jgi:hypothetical protein
MDLNKIQFSLYLSMFKKHACKDFIDNGTGIG